MFIKLFWIWILEIDCVNVTHTAVWSQVAGQTNSPAALKALSLKVQDRDTEIYPGVSIFGDNAVLGNS